MALPGLADAIPVGMSVGMSTDGMTASLPTVAPATSAEDRLSALFDRSYGTMCRIAYLLLRDSAAAEDAVSDAFARVATRWRLLRDHDEAEPYLRQVVVNVCRDMLRRRQTEHRANATVYHLDPQPATASPACVVDDRLRVRAAIDRLPPKQRIAVVLRYYADVSEAEIAEALRCSPGTVKSQLSKARATLGRSLGTEADA